MYTDLEAVKDSILIRKLPETSPFSYPIVCGCCHNTVFFFGASPSVVINVNWMISFTKKDS